MVRCFVGVLLPQYIRTSVLSLEDKIRHLEMEAKFVEPENLHISISFLGEIDENEIERISNVLDEICRRYGKFEATVSGIKLIPNESFIRVIALDVHNGILNAISGDIEREIGGDAKPPHVTICRVKKIMDKPTFLDHIEKLDSNIGKLEISSLYLIKSVLEKTGPIYTVLHESKLL